MVHNALLLIRRLYQKGGDKMDYTVHNVNIDVAINGKPENVKREIREMAELADELKKEHRLLCTLKITTAINADKACSTDCE